LELVFLARGQDEWHSAFNGGSGQRTCVANYLIVRGADRQFDGADLVVNQQHDGIAGREQVLHGELFFVLFCLSVLCQHNVSSA
jgi:hypothetical protein